MKIFFLMGWLTLAIGCTPKVVYKSTPDGISQNNAQDQVFQSWGQRSSLCKDNEDWKTLSFESLKSANDFANQKKSINLSASSAPNNCYRVGSEISIFNEPTKENLVARAIVTQISAAKGSSSINFDVLERFQALKLTGKGERIPNCGERFIDWDDFYISKENTKDVLEQLKQGERTASVWNGSYNCFRIGTKARVGIKNVRGEDYGTITIRSLELVKYADISDGTLMKTGDSVEKSRARLEEGLDRDGGFISVITFEYHPPTPNPKAIAQNSLPPVK